MLKRLLKNIYIYSKKKKKLSIFNMIEWICLNSKGIIILNEESSETFPPKLRTKNIYSLLFLLISTVVK